MSLMKSNLMHSYRVTRRTKNNLRVSMMIRTKASSPSGHLSRWKSKKSIDLTTRRSRNSFCSIEVMSTSKRVTKCLYRTSSKTTSWLLLKSKLFEFTIYLSIMTDSMILFINFIDYEPLKYLNAKV
jgi:hypothetical protein